MVFIKKISFFVKNSQNCASANRINIMLNFCHCIIILAFIGWHDTTGLETINRKWVRIRKQAMTSQNATSGNNGRIKPSSSNVQFSNPWPGQDNRVPYSSQWGPWSWQQVQQGIGQIPYQPPGIQIYPSQAQWYPNSPEYQGFNPALQNQTFRATEGGTSPPTLFYWPPSTSTYSSVPPNAASWGTWAGIQQQGISGGLQKQWQNWYQNADVWAQWQEWLHEKQKQRGAYVDGPSLPASMNYTAPDDTGRILVNLLAGFVAGTTPRKVAMYNMKTYYPQYRRHYWIGGRFFNLDPQITLDSYHTCSYDLPPDIDIKYEVDDARVNEILFQCVKYQETCCKLNCCDMQGRPLYYAGWVGASAQRNNYLGAMNYVISAFIIRFFIYSICYCI